MKRNSCVQSRLSCGYVLGIGTFVLNGWNKYTNTDTRTTTPNTNTNKTKNTNKFKSRKCRRRKIVFA